MSTLEVLQESVLLIEKDPDIRSRIIQAARTKKQVSIVSATDSLAKGLSFLRDDLKGDIIFISSKFAPQDVMEFVSAAKNTMLGRDAAFIAVVQKKDINKVELAEFMLRGMDGFLAIPFNTDMVHAAIDTAVRIKNSKLISRVATASKLLLNDCIKNLDYLTYDAKFRSTKLELNNSMIEAAKIFRSYRKREVDTYFHVMLEMFINTPPPKEFIYYNSKNKKIITRHVTDSQKIRLETQNDDWYKRIKAIEQIISLGNMGEKYLPELTNLAQDINSTCRRRAKMALKKLSIIQ